MSGITETMAYSADTLSYEVISEMAVRELTGPVWVLGEKYNLPKGTVLAWLASSSPGG